MLDGIGRMTYGIAVYTEDTVTIVASVRDISSDHGLVERLAERCEKLA